jgi:hypothetical protein
VTAIHQQNQGGADGSPHLEPLLNEREMAAILSPSVATTRQWRFQGKGVRIVRIGAAIRDRQGDVQSCLDNRSSSEGIKAEVLK